MKNPLIFFLVPILVLQIAQSCGDSELNNPRNGDLNYGFKSNQK